MLSEPLWRALTLGIGGMKKLLGGGGVEAILLIISVQPKFAFPPCLFHDPSPKVSLGGNRFFHPCSRWYLAYGTPSFAAG